MTHPFLDDRSTVVRGPSVLTAIEQESTLRIPITNVPMPQPLPPAHLVIQPQAQVPPHPMPSQCIYQVYKMWCRHMPVLQRPMRHT